jgi:N-acetylglucosaminyldiphosphoundecaprenol N-acetyl-beta-D-mannosaminyltransferase
MTTTLSTTDWSRDEAAAGEFVSSMFDVLADSSVATLPAERVIPARSRAPELPSTGSERTVHLFGAHIAPLKMTEAVERILRWTQLRERCRYVVTPNVDHCVMLAENEAFRRAYDAAALVLADGFPVVLASRLLGKSLPERVTGADLVPALFQAATAERPVSVYLLGAMPGVGEEAARRIRATWPHVRVVGTYSPPLGFEKNAEENRAIIGRINAANPDLLVLGLGAPKQELWIHENAARIDARVALCVGATIDFLAGNKSRAPKWMGRCGLEWIHRVATEPKRLAKRYLRDAIQFPKLLWREWCTNDMPA